MNVHTLSTLVKVAVAKLGGLTTLVNSAGCLVGGAMQDVKLDNYMVRNSSCIIYLSGPCI